MDSPARTNVSDPVADAAKPSRRSLHFDSFDDVLEEADRLVSADREGRLGRAGNWLLGQTFGHLATWCSFALDGYPPEVRAPLPVRLVLRVMRNRILTKGMMPGVKVGRIPGGMLGLDPIDAEEGLRRLRDAYAQLRETAPTIDNPAFGRLTHEEWIQLNLRHAELHLGHQVPT